MSEERKPLHGLTLRVYTKNTKTSTSYFYMTYINGVAYPASKEEIKYHKCPMEVMLESDPCCEIEKAEAEEYAVRYKEFRKRQGWE